MRNFQFILSTLGACFFLPSFAQFTQIKTGSNAGLSEISIIGSTIIINGSYDYLVESTDECKTLKPLTLPAPQGSPSRLQRPDQANMFLLSFNPGQTLVYHSADGGHNWSLKSNTSGAYDHEWTFFDPTEGMMTDDLNIKRTTDAGATWTNIAFPYSILTTAIKAFGDSMVIVGGNNYPGAGGSFALSKDRGKTWPYFYGLSSALTNFFFLNKDTIFGISLRKNFGSNYTRSVDGGSNWQNSYIPMDEPMNLYFKNVNEGYVVGDNYSGIGIILKTTDFCKSWGIFNTGIKTTLYDIAPLNDSTMLVCGTNGVLLKWDYKKTLFTGIKENAADGLQISVFPNPVKNDLTLSLDNSRSVKINKIVITNLIGDELYVSDHFESKPDVSGFVSGVYFVTVHSAQSSRTLKFIKE